MFTETEIKKLYLAYKRSTDQREKNRLRAVWLYATGRKLTYISDFSGLGHKKTILRWLRIYKTRGIKGLRSKKQKGNRSKLTKKQEQVLYEVVRTPGYTYGYRYQNWSISQLKDYISKTYGFFYQSHSSYQNLMKRLKMKPVWARRQKTHVYLDS